MNNFLKFSLVLGFLFSMSCQAISQSKTNRNSSEFQVNPDFYQQQLKLAKEDRKTLVGDKAKGVIVPKELKEAKIETQNIQLQKLLKNKYQMPWDFAELVEKQNNGSFVEIPSATEDYVLDVGNAATGDPFISFSKEERAKTLTSDSAKYKLIANFPNFEGAKYDLSNLDDRKQIRMRLLRMMNPKAKAILAQISKEYAAKFKRPLRFTNLTRSLDYQFTVAGKELDDPDLFAEFTDTIPSHLTGLAFDIVYRQMSAEEQNFMMQLLAKLIREQKILALREALPTVYHVFVLEN